MATRLPPPTPATGSGTHHRHMLNDLKKEAELLTRYHRELSSKQGLDSMPSNESSQMTKLQQERKQLLEWGENLYKEVSRLEREKRKLETDMGKERDTAKQLEHSNAQLLAKCVHLESILQGNASKDGVETVTDYEQADLRKRLSQYAVEVDNLRRENEAALEALNSAQSIAQQRVLERDSYFLTVEELEQSFQKLQEKYTSVEAQLETEQGTKKQLEDRLHEAQLELDVMCASLKLARREAETHVLQLEGVEKDVKEKQDVMRNLVDMIEPLRTCFLKMQQAFAQQTREYSVFVEDVHNHQREGGISLEVAKEEIQILETVTEHLRNELIKIKEEFASTHSELEAQLLQEKEGRTQQQYELELVRDEWERERVASEHLINSKKQQLEALRGTIQRVVRKDAAKPKSARDCNFSREIQEARKGVVVEKLTEKEGKKLKTIYVNPEEFTIIWKRNFPRRGNMYVDLSQVIHFIWGRNSRAYVVGIRKLHAVLKPWLCFSFYTKDRSFDFIIPDGPSEETVLQILVLSICALCKNATGIIHTRGSFIIKKALMKIDETCRWKGISRVEFIHEALKKTATELGKEVPELDKNKDATVSKPITG